MELHSAWTEKVFIEDRKGVYFRQNRCSETVYCRQKKCCFPTPTVNFIAVVVTVGALIALPVGVNAPRTIRTLELQRVARATCNHRFQPIRALRAGGFSQSRSSKSHEVHRLTFVYPLQISFKAILGKLFTPVLQ